MRQVDERQAAYQELEAVREELSDIKSSGINIPWPLIEKARWTAANFKEWRTRSFHPIND